MDEYEKDLPTNKFINEFQSTNRLQEYAVGNLFSHIMETAEPGTKYVGAWFYKNYDYLRVRFNNNKNRCNDLNYWLDLKKDAHEKLFPDKHKTQWDFINRLRIKIESDKFSGKGCEKYTLTYTLADRGKHNELSIYCENRDHLRMLCEQYKDSISANNENCLNLSNYVNKNYKNFFEKYKCLEDNPYKNDYRYYVTNDCTLYNMTKTFPEYNFENKEISEKPNARKAIVLCSEYEKLLSCHNKEDKPEPLIINPTESSCSCPPTQNILYGFLVFLGMISAFFFLYNFTSLGSWLRGHIMKNQVERRDIDEHASYNLTNDISDIITTNTENNGYFLAYEAS
ncbi:PIR protein [Plasmodium ovale]|uniref:PIR protein n=1 Tax=Plasmodium ovale TaxID=36330 RepID=A0A1D3JEF0_PLAOA|nr:PIR protein [Plasmodium ovale]